MQLLSPDSLSLKWRCFENISREEKACHTPVVSLGSFTKTTVHVYGSHLYELYVEP